MKHTFGVRIVNGTLCFMMNEVHRFMFAKQTLHASDSEYFSYTRLRLGFFETYSVAYQ